MKVICLCFVSLSKEEKNFLRCFGKTVGRIQPFAKNADL